MRYYLKHPVPYRVGDFNAIICISFIFINLSSCQPLFIVVFSKGKGHEHLVILCLRVFHFHLDAPLAKSCLFLIHLLEWQLYTCFLFWPKNWKLPFGYSGWGKKRRKNVAFSNKKKEMQGGQLANKILRYLFFQTASSEEKGKWQEVQKRMELIFLPLWPLWLLTWILKENVYEQ